MNRLFERRGRFLIVTPEHGSMVQGSASGNDTKDSRENQEQASTPQLAIREDGHVATSQVCESV
jgi:hypothetical protein